MPLLHLIGRGYHLDFNNSTKTSNSEGELLVYDEEVISRILIAQGYLMIAAFFLTFYIYGQSQVSLDVALSSVGFFFTVIHMSLIVLFLWPLFWGYQVRYHKVENLLFITLWFHISLLCGVLYAVGALAINILYSPILSLISLVYLLPGWFGIKRLNE
jgi:hypothetical protein